MSHKYLYAVPFLLAAFLFNAPASFAKDIIAGRVLAIRGTADVAHAGSEAKAALRKGDPVFLGDKLYTGADSKLKVVFADETIVTLGKNAEISVSEFAIDEGANHRKSVLKLAKGTVRSMVSRSFKGAGSSFEVHTRTAIAGAKGTINIVADLESADPGAAHDTLIIGQEGDTTASNTDINIPGEQNLTGDFGSYVDEGLPPTDPFQVPDTMLNNYFNATNIPEDQGDGSGDGSGEGGGEGSGDSGNDGGGETGGEAAGSGNGGGDTGGEAAGDGGTTGGDTSGTGALDGLKADMDATIGEDSGGVLGQFSDNLVDGALENFSETFQGGDGPTLDFSGNTDGETGDNFDPITSDPGPPVDPYVIPPPDIPKEIIAGVMGFESGALASNWTSLNAEVIDSYGPILPAGGDMMAVVHSGNNNNIGYLNIPLNLNQAGNIDIAFDYNFTTSDYLPFNDYFKAELTGSAGGTQTLVYKDLYSNYAPAVYDGSINNKIIYDSNYPSAPSNMDQQKYQTGWTNYTGSVEMPAGTATLSFTVRDAIDSGLDAAVFLDNISVSGADVVAPTASPEAAAPPAGGVQ